MHVQLTFKRKINVRIAMLGSTDMAKSLVCPCQTIFDGNKVACVFTACWEEKNSFIYLF